MSQATKAFNKYILIYQPKNCKKSCNQAKMAAEKLLSDFKKSKIEYKF